MTWLPVGLAAGVMALAIARTRVFRPLRELVWPGHEDEPPAPLPPGARGWAAYFVTCYVCLGAWLSLGLTVVQGAPDELRPVVAWGASWAVAAAFAATVDRLSA